MSSHIWFQDFQVPWLKLLKLQVYGSGLGCRIAAKIRTKLLLTLPVDPLPGTGGRVKEMERGLAEGGRWGGMAMQLGLDGVALKPRGTPLGSGLR